MKLEPYNKKAKCPKCGETPEDKYLTEAYFASLGLANSSYYIEYLHKIKRYCPNCDYFWFEEPLDNYKI